MTDQYRDPGHAAAIKYQPTVGTFATPSPATDYLCWLTAAPSYHIEIGVAKPEIQRMNKVRHKEEFDTTRRVTIPLAGIVDSYEQGLLLMSALGGDVYAAGPPITHTFKPGGITGAEPQPLISAEVISGRYAPDTSKWLAERLKDGRVENLRWRVNLDDGAILYTCNIVGAYVIAGYVDLPTFTPLGSPFAVNNTVVKRNGSAIFPVISLGVDFTNIARPLNGTPGTAANGPVDVYRHSEGETDATADLVYDSSVDLAASYGDFAARANAALSVLATSATGTDSLLLTLPRVKYDTGEQQTDNDDTRQHVGGDALYDTSTASNASVVLVNAKTAKYNS